MMWQGCYDDGWQGDIVPEAFSHPAKFARGLIHRIYKHAKEMGWFGQDDYVLDPFGGVALGGLEAMSHGLNWVGIELEEKFCKLGEQNIELWNRTLAGWPNLGTARIVKGDSRNLKAMMIWNLMRLQDGIVQPKADLIVSSPPFCQAEGGERGIIDSGYGHGKDKVGDRSYAKHNKAFTVGNLANLPEGKFEMVVGSPPYACDQMGGGGNLHGTRLLML